VLAARFAQLPPSREVAAALQSGTTIAASTGVPQPAAAADPQPVAELLGDLKLAFDYTHLGREGADFFAAMVTRELIAAVPALRRYLIP